MACWKLPPFAFASSSTVMESSFGGASWTGSFGSNFPPVIVMLISCRSYKRVLCIVFEECCYTVLLGCTWSRDGGWYVARVVWGQGHRSSTRWNWSKLQMFRVYQNVKLHVKMSVMWKILSRQDQLEFQPNLSRRHTSCACLCASIQKYLRRLRTHTMFAPRLRNALRPLSRQATQCLRQQQTEQIPRLLRAQIGRQPYSSGPSTFQNAKTLWKAQPFATTLAFSAWAQFLPQLTVIDTKILVVFSQAWVW